MATTGGITPTLLSTDPVCFRRDADGDLLFPLELATGIEAVAIGVRTRIMLCRGEWFLNLTVGVPMFENDVVTADEAILGQKFDPVKTRAAFVREIMTTPGVVDVPLFRMEFDSTTRVLSLTWVARTRFGDTDPDTLDFNI